MKSQQMNLRFNGVKGNAKLSSSTSPVEGYWHTRVLLTVI